jgi:hypothetical protein
MFVGEQRGCGDLVVHRFDSQNRLAVSVRLDALALALSQAPQTIDLTPGSKQAWATVLQLDRSADTAEYFCNDYKRPDWPKPLIKWEAVSGEIVASISRQPLAGKNKQGDKYHATIVLKNVKLRPSMISDEVTKRELIPQECTLERIEIRDVLVGWQPG